MELALDWKEMGYDEKMVFVLQERLLDGIRAEHDAEVVVNCGEEMHYVENSSLSAGVWSHCIYLGISRQINIVLDSEVGMRLPELELTTKQVEKLREMAPLAGQYTHVFTMISLCTICSSYQIFDV